MRVVIREGFHCISFGIVLEVLTYNFVKIDLYSGIKFN